MERRIRMANRRTLITGAASPLGAALVRAFVDEGARVLATDASDERVEQAMAALGLDDCDEVITRGHDESSLGAWWDLSNLIAAFYDQLDVFVHVPQLQPGASLPLAIGRLEQALWNAEEAAPGGTCVVVVAPGSASAAKQAEAALARDGAAIRVHAIEPEAPAEVARRVVDLVVDQGRSAPIAVEPDRRRSQSSDETPSETRAAGEVVVEALTIYPVKGCQGTPLSEARITQRGVVGDRLFALVADGEPLDQIKAPQLGGVGVSWDEQSGVLVFEHPEHGRYEHVRRVDGALVPTHYVLDDFAGRDQGDAVADWLSDVAGRKVRLITSGEAWAQSLPLEQFKLLHQQMRERFYSVSPVSLSNRASLEDLNGRLQSPVPMNRFRMNVVVSGLDPYQEETIGSLSTPEVRLERVTVAERCIIVTTDQETGIRTKSDLLQTLNRFHRRPKGERFGSGLVFGAYLAVTQEGVLRVGDRLAVA
jgi:hypothetical protein